MLRLGSCLYGSLALRRLEVRVRCVDKQPHAGWAQRAVVMWCLQDERVHAHQLIERKLHLRDNPGRVSHSQVDKGVLAIDIYFKEYTQEEGRRRA